MREISDAFLLGIAEVSASLVGLFLVGVFVYVETGLVRGANGRAVESPYIRSSAQIVIILYAIPIGLSLTLVAMDLIWSRLLLVVLSILLIAANVDTVRRLRTLARTSASPTLIATEGAGTVGVVLLVTLPWILGGLQPSREDLAWSILIAFAAGFIGIWAVVLTAFDVGGRASEVVPQPVAETQRPKPKPARKGRSDPQPPPPPD